MGYSTGLGGDFLDSFQRWVAGRTGLGRVVAFWHHIPPAIFPEMPSPDPRSFSHQEDAQAVDTLFTWLLEYLDETAAAGIAPADPEPERGA